MLATVDCGSLATGAVRLSWHAGDGVEVVAACMQLAFCKRPRLEQVAQCIRGLGSL